MTLSLLNRLCGRRFFPVWFFGNIFGGGCLHCLPGLSVGNGSFQAIEHVPYPIEEILDHEG